MSEGQSAIKVFLVNGESRSVRVDERMDVTVRRCELVCPAHAGAASLTGLRHWERVLNGRLLNE